jgi:hypothetical protein
MRLPATSILNLLRSIIDNKAIRWMLTLSILTLLLWTLDLGRIGSILSGVKISFLGGAVLAAIISNIFAIAAWKLLLDGVGVRLTYKAASAN